MKRPLAYISCALEKGNIQQQTEMTNYCRTVYEAGYFPICPPLFLPYFIRDEIPTEHKDGIDMSRDLLKRCHVLVVCGKEIDEGVRNCYCTKTENYRYNLGGNYDHQKAGTRCQ